MRPSRQRDERGSASAFIVGIAVTMLVLAGLVVDGGGALNARMTLADDVEAAAIAGAQAVDLDALHDRSVIVIDEAAARQRAHEVLAGRGYEDVVVRVDVLSQLVTVSARDTIATKMLNLIGFNQFDISASATADAEILNQ